MVIEIQAQISVGLIMGFDFALLDGMILSDECNVQQDPENADR